MAFNIRMTTGPVGAFLFFAQIIGSYYHFIFDYSVKDKSDEAVVYAIGSIFAIVTVIIIPTLILLFHPIMIAVSRYFKWGDTKCVTFINS